MADSMSTMHRRRSEGAASRNARRTRDDILAAAVERLVRGEEPTMRAVAGEAGVGERTIYRYFPTRESLESGLRDHLMPRLGVPLCSSVEGLEDYVEALFDVFEANRELTVAMVSSPWTQTSLAGTRARNLADMAALLRAGFPAADPHDVSAAAAALRTVLSGAGWVYQRHGCGLTAEQVRSNAIWTVRQVLATLDGGSDRSHPGPRPPASPRPVRPPRQA